MLRIVGYLCGFIMQDGTIRQTSLIPSLILIIYLQPHCSSWLLFLSIGVPVSPYIFNFLCRHSMWTFRTDWPCHHCRGPTRIVQKRNGWVAFQFVSPLSSSLTEVFPYREWQSMVVTFAIPCGTFIWYWSTIRFSPLYDAKVNSEKSQIQVLLSNEQDLLYRRISGNKPHLKIIIGSSEEISDKYSYRVLPTHIELPWSPLFRLHK